jgi:hypothetical protein
MNNTTPNQTSNGGLVNLDEAMKNQNSFGRPVKTFAGFNTGNRTFVVLMSLFEIQEFTEVANEQSTSTFIAQRKLDISHAHQIAKYILKGLLSSVDRKFRKEGAEVPTRLMEILDELGRQPYLSIPPIVASFRNCQPDGTNLKVMPMLVSEGDTACYKIFINHGDVYWVIDGQHRRKGIQLVFEFLDYVITHRKYEKKALYSPGDRKEVSNDELSIWSECLQMSKSCTIAVEVHLGLNQEQERQLFHDLNNLQKKVEKSLALQFDNSNPVNSFIKGVLIDDVFHQEEFSTHEKDKVNWQDEENGLTRKDLVAVNALLLLNKTNINNALPMMMHGKEDTAKMFWERVLQIPGLKESRPRQKTVAAQPVVLKAMAKLVYDFFFGRNAEWTTLQNQTILMDGIRTIDFSHTNPMWRYYSFTVDELKQNGLATLGEYLPDNAEGNRDIGNFDSANEFRFGAKHNDIYPIVGDMIRWRLGLPKRRKD